MKDEGPARWRSFFVLRLVNVAPVWRRLRCAKEADPVALAIGDPGCETAAILRAKRSFRQQHLTGGSSGAQASTL
jgi:hypothetical protein